METLLCADQVNLPQDVRTGSSVLLPFAADGWPTSVGFLVPAHRHPDSRLEWGV
jgi:hypothetical protein